MEVVELWLWNFKYFVEILKIFFMKSNVYVHAFFSRVSVIINQMRTFREDISNRISEKICEFCLLNLITLMLP